MCRSTVVFHFNENTYLEKGLAFLSPGQHSVSEDQLKGIKQLREEFITSAYMWVCIILRAQNWNKHTWGYTMTHQPPLTPKQLVATNTPRLPSPKWMKVGEQASFRPVGSQSQSCQVLDHMDVSIHVYSFPPEFPRVCHLMMAVPGSNIKWHLVKSLEKLLFKVITLHNLGICLPDIFPYFLCHWHKNLKHTSIHGDSQLHQKKHSV